jgi:hypothetical protein
MPNLHPPIGRRSPARSPAFGHAAGDVKFDVSTQVAVAADESGKLIYPYEKAK